ncbi:hypothetical protein DQ04_01401040 [Trypanosoma grayi]|uniref:hypothetical protein n=1 Tax=Trypanosoma grayi TaxID=71804 RepID=UPI0004F43256|nr:hypothetical protein DQ04_01401040 [Trypanosoma grayi]KEG12820.1 hypothetical protein DQ04_01401040 [Trypanosoma grayi]
MRRSARRLQAGALAMLMDTVSTQRVELGPEDIYRICALLKAKEDTLMLQTNQAFLHGIRAQYQKMDVDAVTPFQRTFIDGAFAGLSIGVLGSHSETGKGENEMKSGTPAGVSEQRKASRSVADTLAVGAARTVATAKVTTADVSLVEPAVEERISAIWESVQECQSNKFVSSDGMRRIKSHCKALERQLRQMKPFEVVSLVKALATIHYQDYTFTNLLTRRSCEVASKFSSSELCRTYFNLSKLQSHDSMVAFVNQIEAQMEKLHQEQVQFVAMALERQPQIASAPARMVPKLLTRAVHHLPETEGAAYHRTLLVVAARYNLRRHPSVNKIFLDSARHMENITERDLLAILQAAVDLGISVNTPGLAELLKKAESIVETVDIRNIDAFMDILSVLPIDTGAIMAKVMQRLAVDAGKLSIPQVVFTLDLISSYPPAKGDPCIAALVFAASLRADSFDGEGLEQVVLNLAQLQQFSDDFYVLVSVLQNNKGGFRSFDRLASLMKCCTQEVVTDVRGQDMITKGILGLAPTMNDEELAESRKMLSRIGVNDKNVHQMIFRRAKQLQRESGGRWAKRGHNTSDDFV